MSAGSLGELQHLVLLAVMRLEDAAYGVRVRDEIHDVAGRDLTLGAIYSALTRLERGGLLTSRLGAVEPRAGGKAKTYFRVTREGRAALRRAQGELVKLATGVPGLPLSPPVRNGPVRKPQ